MSTPRDDTDHPIFAALYDPVMWGLERTVLPRHREYLARDLSGAVLDLGAGTGAMFPYLAAVEDGLSLHAIEPDPNMRQRAARKARDLGLDVDLRDAGAGDLPYDDDAFDAVIASIVFCTIPDVDAALEEVARVLKPRGELRFLEHVHSDGLRGRVQNAVTPLWRRVAGGCHPNRDTNAAIAADPDLDLVDLDRLDVGFGVIKPFVRGTAVRRV